MYSETGTNRIEKWDNLKALMIFCVVAGHILYVYTGSSGAAKGIYLFLYTFHMPVLIFLSGMFSRHTIREKKMEKVIEYVFVYVVMKFLEYIGDYLVNAGKALYDISVPEAYAHIFSDRLQWRLLHSDKIMPVLRGCRTSFHFLWTDAPSWFALAMAVFLLITMYIQKYDKACCLGIALMIGCLAGLDNHFGNHYASLRICVFYPVFLMGYYTDHRIFEKEKYKTDKETAVNRTGRKTWGKSWLLAGRTKVAAGIWVILCLLVCLRFADKLYPYVTVLKGTANYAKTGLGILGIFVRAAGYLFWGSMIMAWCILAPDGKTPFSWIGAKTMPIFIWHRLPVYILFVVCYGGKNWNGKYYLMWRLPHCYLAAALCIAGILTLLTTYLPEFRISDRIVGRTSEIVRK